MTGFTLNLSTRDRRALSAAAIVVGGGWSAKLGLPALHEWETTQRTAAVAVLNDRAAAIAGARTASVLDDSVRARSYRLASLDSGIVSVATVAEGGAALSSIVADVAEAANVRVTSLQIRGDTVVRGGFARVAVRLIGVSDVAGLAALLHDVEANDVSIAVRELSVAQSDPAAPSSHAESLRIDLLAETLVRVKAGR
jgi:hypothetical protein